MKRNLKRLTLTLAAMLCMTAGAWAQSSNSLRRGAANYDKEKAKVVWSFSNTEDINENVVDPEGIFTTVAANLGDNVSIAGTGRSNTLPGVTFVKLTPSDKSDKVEWSVKPADGLSFTPTKISANIVRFGTDVENGVVVTAKTGNGNEVTLGTFTALRDNKDFSTDKFKDKNNLTNKFEIELTPDQQQMLASTNGETFYLYATVGVPSGKSGGFANVTIEGTVSTAEAPITVAWDAATKTASFTMPANNVELQVEYYPESNIFLGKEALADKTNFVVKNDGMTLQFGEDGKSANTVAETSTVTAQYTGGKKILGMKVAKKDDDPLATPLTMEVLTAGTVKVTMGATLSTGMKYAVNGGEKTTITETTEISDLKVGDKVQFYGNGTQTQVYGDNPEVTITGGSAEVKVYGNIMSLLDEEGYATLTTLPESSYVFYGLFNENTKLTDASGLLLPATTLATYCYRQMFNGCSSLTAAPNLPATTLAQGCYRRMFGDCSSLTAAPDLPATTLESECYRQMFLNCSKLASVKCLATNPGGSPTNSWLNGAGSDVTGDKFVYTVSTADWPEGNNGIPSGWTRQNIDN